MYTYVGKMYIHKEHIGLFLQPEFTPRGEVLSPVEKLTPKGEVVP
jgi:hypothetical protein